MAESKTPGLAERKSYRIDWDPCGFVVYENPVRETVRDRKVVMVPDVRGPQIELTADEFADYERVVAEFDRWQVRLGAADREWRR